MCVRKLVYLQKIMFKKILFMLVFILLVVVIDFVVMILILLKILKVLHRIRIYAIKILSEVATNDLLFLDEKK